MFVRKLILAGVVFTIGWFSFENIIENILNRAAFYPRAGTVFDLATLPPPMEHHFITTDDSLRISAFYLPNEATNRTILFFHGNAGNASQRIHLAVRMWNLGVGVLLPDYRGFGLSEGKPDEKGIYLDAKASLEFLTEENHIPVDSIWVYGRSLGSAVAVHLAQNLSFAGIILVSPLSSGYDVAQYRGYGMLSRLMADRFDSLSKIRNVVSPLFIIHGDKDEVLPLSMGIALSQESPVSTQFVTLSGANHDDIISRDPDYFFQIVNGFLHRSISYFPDD